MTKSLAKWLFILPSVLIFTVYLILAGYLWWSENVITKKFESSSSVGAREKSTHKIVLLDDGLISLAKRVEFIRSAKKTIELEFFIYEVDLASRIITGELIKAAASGVKVRLLVDFSLPVFKLKPAYAKYLKSKGIEVKYYNTVDSYRFISAQHRSHRKLLVVDGVKAVTGGRNIGDDYFNLSHHYNFLDSDIAVEGPIVETIQKSFLTYWNSDYSRTAGDIDDSEQLNVDEYFGENAKAESTIAGALAILETERNNLFRGECSDITFVTDHPGVLTQNRRVYDELAKFLSQAKTELVGESPYFVLRGDGLKLIESLSEQGLKIKVLTNGLASTDAFYTVSAMSLVVGELESAGIDVYLYNGGRPAQFFKVDPEVSDRWGVHAKRAVVDRKHVLIGTYNVDPRSANLNSELLIICRDSPAFASAVLASMESRFAGSRPLFHEDRNPYLEIMDSAKLSQKISFVLALPLARLFDFLL